MQYGRPIADISVGGWGNTPLWDKVDEVTPDDGTTQIQTGNQPSNDTCEVRLSAVSDPLIDSAHTLRVRAYTTGAGSITYGLYQGATQIASQTSVLGGAYATFAINLTTEQVAAITNYADLRVRLTANGSSGRVRVTWVELETPDVTYAGSGAASVSGGGSPIASIVKAALMAAVLVGGGTVVAAGQETFNAVVHGGGALAVAAKKEYQATTGISGGDSGFYGYVTYADNFDGSAQDVDLALWDEWERQTAFPGKEFTLWGYTTCEGGWLLQRYLKRSVPTIKDINGLQFATVTNEGFTASGTSCSGTSTRATIPSCASPGPGRRGSATSSTAQASGRLPMATGRRLYGRA